MISSIKDQSQKAQRELPVLITVDVCDGAYEPGERKSRFKNIMEVLLDVRSKLNEAINGGKEKSLPVTWFVRADGQVKENIGDTAGLLRGWSKFWQEVKSQGGEIGWHPHLYKRDDQGWRPIRDPKRLASEAEHIWRDIAGSGWHPQICRIGESVCSTELMCFLDSVGILVDATALPGRARDDGLRWFDWMGTPNTPYHPARCDYRRPAQTLGSSDKVEGEEPLGIIEIPFTMAEIRAPYDSTDPAAKPPRRYLDLSYDPDRFRRGVVPFLKSWNYLVAVIHPLQASERDIPEGGLVVGGTDVLKKNLQTILENLEEIGRNPNFLTISSFKDLWLKIKKDDSETATPEREKKPHKKHDSQGYRRELTTAKPKTGDTRSTSGKPQSDTRLRGVNRPPLKGRGKRQG